jgi:ketosteroid isomerase-like protein
VLTEQTREVVEAFTDARMRNDANDIAQLLAEDVVWHPPHAIRSRPFVGRERVTKALTGGTTASVLDVSTIKRQILQTVVQDDTAVVRQLMTANLLAGGTYRNDYCWVYKCADDKIIELVEYSDSLQTARAGFVPLKPAAS